MLFYNLRFDGQRSDNFERYFCSKVLAVLIMDIDDNLLSEKSPLNTQLDENELVGCSNDSYINSASEPEDEIPSYQPIKKPTEITAKNQRNGENKKIKAEVKFQILRLHFWIQLYTKANVAEIIPFWI